MTFKPFEKMWERIEVARDDSNTALFYDLLLLGEMMTKVVAAGLISAVDDDRERHRYQQLYRLVRADGIGEWSQVIDDVLTGPTSQNLIQFVREEHRELTQAQISGTWQYDAVYLLNNCLKAIDSACEQLPTKVSCRRWFSIFARLRNKTRGHGAVTGSSINAVVSDLETSIRLFIDNFRLFNRSWAYVYPILSGKYRVTKLTPSATSFDPLKTKQALSIHIPDGVYIHFDETSAYSALKRVDLIQTNVDAMDFHFVNGGFTSKRYELISYITDSRVYGDSSLYLVPPSDLPKSETQGLGILDVQGKSFGNLPPKPIDYIRRTRLENELYQKLLDDRHPVITLVGRGGIGKTWLALSVLYKVAEAEKFTAILWFSARDIDLLPIGPKPVQPHILHEGDIADEFVRLTEPSESKIKGFKASHYLTQQLGHSQIGPVLFVFDNFETVRSPVELFTWLDTYIRLPNKIMITTRHRDFKGDYPVDVLGMEYVEAEELIQQTADHLGISHLLSEKYMERLLDEADGHPYVIKVLLGEVAKAQQLVEIRRIIASKEDILDALFERTFASLMPVSKRVFLTLCNWRVTVPQLAIEAVLLRPENERMDVRAAIEELERSSFIEVRSSEQDDEIFLSVPLVAAFFGQRKLAVDPSKTAIDADTELLREFGAAKQSDIHRGIAPRIEKLFRNIASRITRNSEDINLYLPMLEYIARQFDRAWLLIADLYEELDAKHGGEHAKEAVKRYLETSKDDQGRYEAWKRLAALCRRSGDSNGEVHALVAMAELPAAHMADISHATNTLNAMLREQRLIPDIEEKRVIAHRLANLMENKIHEANPTDLSRIAWLYMHLQNQPKAKEFVTRGLELDPNNDYCLSLASRLNWS